MYLRWDVYKVMDSVDWWRDMSGNWIKIVKKEVQQKAFSDRLLFLQSSSPVTCVCDMRSALLYGKWLLELDHKNFSWVYNNK